MGGTRFCRLISPSTKCCQSLLATKSSTINRSKESGFLYGKKGSFISGVLLLAKNTSTGRKMDHIYKKNLSGCNSTALYLFYLAIIFNIHHFDKLKSKK